jgi:HEAT repeat protein
MRADGASRGTLGLAVLLTTGSGLGGACGRGPESVPDVEPPATDSGVRDDRRVAELLVDCAQSGFYDRDLSDLVPVLLEKLERARPDPLKRAKEELGQLGARAFPALGASFHANYTDLMRSAFLENVVDALSFNSSDESHELLLEALQHPQESVRSKALDGLERLARPADFELLAERLAIETRELRRQSVAPLFRADRARAEALFLDAIARGEERDLWLLAGTLLVESQSAETARRCAEVFPSLEAPLASYLAAAAARNGHATALEFLRAELRSEDLQHRLQAVSVLQRTGLVDELGIVLLEDASSDARAIAAAALGAAPPDETRRGWLRAALDDAHPVVRSEALRGLCAQDDPEGLGRALAQLHGDPVTLAAALMALRAPLRRSPELARSAFQRLLERHALEEHRPLQQRTATFKGIGQMPLREAAAFLHELGVAAGEERIESLRAHDWLMIQAANTDVQGRTHLAEVLRGEHDALRRLDLIDALGSIRDELARSVLLELVEQETATPLERLFVASVLVKIGPSWEIAPRLKRVAFTLQGAGMAEARAGLQCLLWHWY